ncbi:Neuronal acetylcholine receptor subunit alpha-9-II [Holothuria leucospilota]|uniref:Neuronal acetylcholine receptor subunit alpha-9-II n=1 Tax=Holothuria leucospilota TaxID=206669 RepID=A0A9Q0YIH9_HOLLE|nr:Neuronal acetylcholine receptor subunit alpha-9-II [Holothuria leucospilota]
MFSSEAAIVLLVFLIGNSSGLRRKNVNDLVRDLMKRYKDTSESFLPPLNDNLDPVDVNLSWYPTNIMLFNERDQYIEFGGFITMEWHDPVLQWNSSVTGINSVEFPLSEMWKPKLVLQESRTYDYASIFYENNLASIYHNGTVSWKSPVKTSTFCRVLETRFPFDQQACTLTFSSSVSYQTGIKFNYLNTPLENVTITYGVWKVGSLVVPNCPETVKFKTGAAIRFVIGMKSQMRQRYYMVTLVIPCILLSGFTPLVLFMPGETNSKVPLLTFHIVTIFLYQSLIDGVGPPTGNSLLSMFALLTMLETAVVTILSIISTRLYHKKALRPDRINCTLRTGKKGSSSTVNELSQIVENIESYNGRFAMAEKDDLERSGENTTLLECKDDGQKEACLSSPQTDTPGRDVDETNKDVDKFDCTAGFIIIFFKCIWYIVFIILYRLSRYNPSDIIQCSDGYDD